MQVTIVDYGTGNIHSVQKAIDTAAKDISKNIKIKVSNNSKEILNSDKLILPGQGSYKQCMDNIEKIPNKKLNNLRKFFVFRNSNILFY